MSHRNLDYERMLINDGDKLSVGRLNGTLRCAGLSEGVGCVTRQEILSINLHKILESGPNIFLSCN